MLVGERHNDNLLKRETMRLTKACRVTNMEIQSHPLRGFERSNRYLTNAKAIYKDNRLNFKHLAGSVVIDLMSVVKLPSS